MSGRTYLSIGDVLSLLQEEFPDITISKIRFLESQGLVDPERSPSGYRKFYDHDVERLRWVLRQQREHFLPLKVIRDRLARDGDSCFTEDEEPVAHGHAEPSFGEHRANGSPAEPAVTLVREIDTGDLPTLLHVPESSEQHAAARETAHALAGGPPSGAPDRSPETLPSMAQAAPRDPGSTSPTVPSSPTSPASSTGRTASTSPAVSARPEPDEPGERPIEHSGGPVPQGKRRGLAGAQRPAPDRTGRPHRAESGREGAGPAGTRQSGRRGPDPRDGGEQGETPEPPPALTGASLTIEELGSISGLQRSEIAVLETFGLIQPIVVTGVSYYGEDALAVARIVAGFAQFGIQPRHLRQYRNRVEREVDLIEQVIAPLMRQRNPESRVRAMEAAAELGRLGQNLHNLLLEKELRHTLGG